MKDRLRLRLAGRPAPLIVALVLGVVLYLAGVILIPGFGSAFSLRSISVLAAFLGVAAAGQTMVIILGGIDLSIAFVIGFANVVAAEMSGAQFPLWLTVVVVLGLSAAIGALSGLISSRLGVHPLIVTLGVGTVALGAVLLWTKGLASGTTPPGLMDFVSLKSSTGPLPLPPLVVMWLLFTGALIFILKRTVYGRQLYALGSSPVAARLALVRPARVWTATFAASAACSGLAGILLLGFTGTAYGDVGSQYLFLSIAATVAGGTSMIGGSGGYGGTFIGALVLTELTMILVGFGLTAAAQQTLFGLVLLALLSLYGREAPLRNRL